MDNLDKAAIEAIIERLQNKLNRDLTLEEREPFTLLRSLMAYEMIMDYISDESLSVADTERYVAAVVDEHKQYLAK